ncbi:MAG: carbon-nitrogen hydrolase family protein, partial [Acidobacteriota bacterium]
IGAELQDEEGILYGDLDLAACVEPKQFHDVVGYYNRFDIFDVTVDRRANRPISFHDGMKPQMDEPIVSGTSRGDELS